MTFDESWEWLRGVFGYNDLLLNVVGRNLVIAVIFWSLNAVLLTFDLTGKPKWILQYKTQQDQEIPVDRDRLMKAIRRVIFNETVVMIPMSVFNCWLHQMAGCPSTAEELPSIGRFLRDSVGYVAIADILFYTAHRTLHYGPLYKWIHKTHHEWTAPIGVTAMYCHPLELAFANMIPISMGPVIMRSHILSAWVWWAIAITNTTLVHSGYHFPLSPSNEFHDYHHKTFNQNFGSFGVMDWLFGTSDQYRKTIHYKHDRNLLSLKPMHEWIPEAKPSKAE